MRVADIGGGFGGFAGLALALPEARRGCRASPSPAAIALAAKTPNVCHVDDLTGTYDLLIATDVFEHVGDPISLAATSSTHLRIGGHFLIANCFSPVIACHLPQLFHFSFGWDQVMRSMGLDPLQFIQYARVFRRTGDLNPNKALRAAALAKRVSPFVHLLPKGRIRFGRALSSYFFISGLEGTPSKLFGYNGGATCCLPNSPFTPNTGIDSQMLVNVLHWRLDCYRPFTKLARALPAPNLSIPYCFIEQVIQLFILLLLSHRSGPTSLMLLMLIWSLRGFRQRCFLYPISVISKPLVWTLRHVGLLWSRALHHRSPLARRIFS